MADRYTDRRAVADRAADPTAPPVPGDPAAGVYPDDRAAPGYGPLGYPAGYYYGYDEPMNAWTQQTEIASGLNFLAGLWLILAPFVLDFGTVARDEGAFWNSIVLGIAVAVLALARLAAPRRFSGLSWVNAIIGIWLIISPWVLDYTGIPGTDSAQWNSVILGGIVLVLAIWSAVATWANPNRGKAMPTTAG